jgi:hypothetical protein
MSFCGISYQVDMLVVIVDPTCPAEEFRVFRQEELIEPLAVLRLF